MTHPLDERALEAVFEAISKAYDTHYRDFGLHDYTGYGRPVPHVVRDYRIREGSQILFESTDANEAQAFHKRHRAQYVARAGPFDPQHNHAYLPSVLMAHWIRICATSWRVNSAGGSSPRPSISRTFVPLRKTWSSLPCGQVLIEAMLPQARQKN